MDAWRAAQRAYAIIHKYGWVSGYSIAQKLGVPCGGAMLFPLTPRQAFPSFVLARVVERGPTLAISGLAGRVCADNWRALRSVGESANRRLCDAQAQDAMPAPDVVTLAQVTRPSTTADGFHAPTLCFGDPQVMAILCALLLFCRVLAGFHNRDLVQLVGSLLDRPYTALQEETYDLRRLRRKGLIMRLPGFQRYQLTRLGRRVAVLFTKAHGRVLGPGLALLQPDLSVQIGSRSPLARAWRQLERSLDDVIATQLIAKPSVNKAWSAASTPITACLGGPSNGLMPIRISLETSFRATAFVEARQSVISV